MDGLVDIFGDTDDSCELAEPDPFCLSQIFDIGTPSLNKPFFGENKRNEMHTVDGEDNIICKAIVDDNVEDREFSFTFPFVYPLREDVCGMNIRTSQHENDLNDNFSGINLTQMLDAVRNEEVAVVGSKERGKNISTGDHAAVSPKSHDFIANFAAGDALLSPKSHGIILSNAKSHNISPKKSLNLHSESSSLIKGIRNLVSEARKSHSEQAMENTGFSTGGGAVISIKSVEALRRAENIVKSCLEGDMSIENREVTSVLRFSEKHDAARFASHFESGEALRFIDAGDVSPTDNEKFQEITGFSTANGTSITTSSTDSLKRAKCLIAECMTDLDEKGTTSGHLKSIVQLPKHIPHAHASFKPSVDDSMKDAFDDSCFATISPEVRLLKTAISAENCTFSESTTTIDFDLTAPMLESNIEVSDSDHSNNKDPSKIVGFCNGKGSFISISSESMIRARQLFDACSNEFDLETKTDFGGGLGCPVTESLPLTSSRMPTGIDSSRISYTRTSNCVESNAEKCIPEPEFSDMLKSHAISSREQVKLSSSSLHVNNNACHGFLQKGNAVSKNYLSEHIQTHNFSPQTTRSLGNYGYSVMKTTVGTSNILSGFSDGKCDNIAASNDAAAHTMKIFDGLSKNANKDVEKENVCTGEQRTCSRPFVAVNVSGFSTGRGASIEISSDEALNRAKSIVYECMSKPEFSNVIEKTIMNGDKMSQHPSSPHKTIQKAVGLNDTSLTEPRLSFGEIFADTFQNSVPLKLCNFDTKVEGSLADGVASNEFHQLSPIVAHLAPRSERLEPAQSSPRFDIEENMQCFIDLDSQFTFSQEHGKLHQETIVQRAEARREQRAFAENRFLSTRCDTRKRETLLRPGERKSSLSSDKLREISRQPSSPGLLWHVRRSGAEDCSFVQAATPFVEGFELTLDGLFSHGVKIMENIPEWSLSTAGNLVFCLDDSKERDVVQPTSYRFGDEIDIIPNETGHVGLEEVICGFICSPGVTPGLVSRDWIAHHFVQLAWRLGSIVFLHPRDRALRTLNNLPLSLPTPSGSIISPIESLGHALLHVFLLQLKYRYDRELEAVERSSIRKILERDDTPSKRIVLCVSQLEPLQNNLFRGQLTDGWYHIGWVPDPVLKRQIIRGRIRVGSKLITAGAELVQAPSGFGGDNNLKMKSPANPDQHLFASSGLALHLHANSTRLVSSRARLGYASAPPHMLTSLPSIPLCSLVADGGNISSILVLVQRRFKLQFMETRLNEAGSDRKVRIFRDPRSEEAAEREHSEICQTAVNKIVGEFSSPKAKRFRRTQPTSASLAALGTDGEALWGAVSGAPDPGLAESDLSSLQRDAMLQFKETTMRDLIAEKIPKREISTTRVNDPFAPSGSSTSGKLVSLSGGRSLVFRQLSPRSTLLRFSKASDSPLAVASVRRLSDVVCEVYRPRISRSVSELGTFAENSPTQSRTNTVDFSAFVVGWYKAVMPNLRPSSDSPKPGVPSLSDLAVVYLADTDWHQVPEETETDASNCDSFVMAVLRVWGGLERFCLTTVLRPGQRVNFTDVQVRGRSIFRPLHDFPPATDERRSYQSEEIHIVNLNYTAASYVVANEEGQSSAARWLAFSRQSNSGLEAHMKACMNVHFEHTFSKSASSFQATPLRQPQSLHTPFQSRASLPCAPCSVIDKLSTPRRSNSSVRGLSALLRGESITPPPPVLMPVATVTKSRTRTGLSRPRSGRKTSVIPKLSIATTLLSSSPIRTRLRASQESSPTSSPKSFLCDKTPIRRSAILKTKSEVEATEPSVCLDSSIMETSLSSADTDLDVSIADLVKTRRRSSVLSSPLCSQHLSRTPRSCSRAH